MGVITLGIGASVRGLTTLGMGEGLL